MDIKTATRATVASPPSIERTPPPPTPAATNEGSALSEKIQRLDGNEALAEGWRGVGERDEDALVIAVIDDFVPETNPENVRADGSQFNHGKTMESIIESGGALEGAGFDYDGEIRTINYNVDVPGASREEMISNALYDVIERAEAGEHVDAVNLSQQSWGDSAFSEEIDEAITILQEEYGIPVVVAAGNSGPGQVNRLAEEAMLVVENAEFGDETRASSSGRGNVRSEGVYTSQATANAAVLAALLQDQGLEGDNLVTVMRLTASASGGALDAGPYVPVFDPA